MNIVRRFLGPSKEERVDLRRMGNVIADAVETAKKEELAAVREELAAAREEGRQARGKVNLAVRGVHTLHRAVIAAGERAEEVIERGLGDD